MITHCFLRLILIAHAPHVTLLRSRDWIGAQQGKPEEVSTRPDSHTMRRVSPPYILYACALWMCHVLE